MQAKIKALFLVCAIGVATSSAQDWSQWRGPSRAGAAPSFTAPATWPEQPTQKWKVAPAGVGHASPVIAGDRVFLHSRLGEQETVTAFDLASGKHVWQDKYDVPYQMNPAARSHGKGPKSTPTVDRGRLFTFGITGTLSAFDARSGRLLWRKEHKEFPVTAPDFGTAMSPVVEGTNVIVHAGGSRNGALIAYDAATGASRWSWKGDGPSYSSPVAAMLGGTRQLVTQTQGNIVGISAADGKLLWQIPFTTEYEQNIITPVFFGGMLIYAGLNKPTTAIRITQAGGKWTTEQVWQNADVPMYMSSPVEAGGYLYGLTHRNRGQFFCLDAKTGKTMWTTRGREGENAALVTARGLILAVTTEGVLVVAPQNSKAFQPIKRYTVADSPVWAHPAPAGRGIAIKDADSLTFWTF